MLHHPNILQLYGSGMVKNASNKHQRPLIVLEALNGDTLAYHLSLNKFARNRPFTELRYLRMARELLAALLYLHRDFHPHYCVIHRDLKPDNLAFSSDGCTGSLRYMAPEVALSHTYNCKVDIYGFALILYELVTGVTPFKGCARDDFYARVVRAAERPDMTYDEYGKEVRCKEEIKDLIHRCWDPLPTRRPSAAEAFELLKTLRAEGPGGMPEFIEAIPADEVVWGAFKVVGVDDRGNTISKRPKYIFVKYIPRDGMSAMKKAKAGRHKGEIKNVINAPIDFEIEDPSELTEEVIEAKLRASGGAHAPTSYEYHSYTD
ncbi:unnamed protein product [Sphagnum balticum]